MQFEVRIRCQPQDRQGDWHRNANLDPAACRSGNRVKRRDFISLLGGAACAGQDARARRRGDRMICCGAFGGLAHEKCQPCPPMSAV
jgi:hypothetical protein